MINRENKFNSRVDRMLRKKMEEILEKFEVGLANEAMNYWQCLIFAF